VTYSYTQISQYLSCPRRYRYRYVDGWQEKDTRAAMLFGRCFEKAVAAYFKREDPAVVLFEEWSAFRDVDVKYGRSDSWDRMLHQGFQLLDRFSQDDRIRVPRPGQDQQVKFTRRLSVPNDFVAYIDALGTVDGKRCVLEWKTTGTRYPDEPAGLLTLDPQLVCYSWITGVAEVAQVVFVRKRLVEIQYLVASISDQQRKEFGLLVESTISQIESAQFLPHSGVRFPQNPCVSCSHLGLCLRKPELVEAKLMRQPGGDPGLFDELRF